MAILRALHAEQLKMKRTLAFWLAPLAPLVIIALQVAMVMQRQAYYRAQEVANAWIEYAGQTVFLWAILMLPLFITLETALLANLEHGSGQWKHLFALPVPRGAIYAAKQVSSLAIIGLSMAALYAYIVASGFALRVLTPGLGLEAPVPWWDLFRHVALPFLASWLILAIHTWVGLRWQSFVVASAAGIAAMVVAVVMFESDWAQWYPWTLPGLVANGVESGQDVLPLVLIGSLGGVGVALLGGWDVVRRDVL